ncbi:MAG: hypothetical protein ACI4RN_04920 [Oscillospiraceae bacterium]
MAKKAEPLKVICHLSVNGRDGPYKRWEDCTDEEIELFRRKTSEKLSNSLSNYYSANPQEFKKLVEKSENSA